MIPEIYFSKLELIASLLDGEDSYEAAQKQKNISAEDLIDMLMIAGKYLKSRGENEKASSQFRIAKRSWTLFLRILLKENGSIRLYMNAQVTDAPKLKSF